MEYAVWLLLPCPTGGNELLPRNCDSSGKGEIGLLREIISALALLVCADASVSLDFPMECVYIANTPTAELEPHARCAALMGVLFADFPRNT